MGSARTTGKVLWLRGRGRLIEPQPPLERAVSVVDGFLCRCGVFVQVRGFRSSTGLRVFSRAGRFSPSLASWVLLFWGAAGIIHGLVKCPLPGAAIMVFSLSWPVLGSKKRYEARGRVLVGCWVSVHGFGAFVRLRGLERVLVVFGG